MKGSSQGDDVQFGHQRTACRKMIHRWGRIERTFLFCLLTFACTEPVKRSAEVPSSRAPAARAPENGERPWMLPATVRPEHYDLRLRLDPNADRFSGVVAIDVVAPEPVAALVLHGRELKVERATILAGSALVDARVSERQGADPRAAPDLLVLEVEEPLVGKLQVRIEYSAPYRGDMRGLYRTKLEDKNYLFTQFQPMDARSAFPCFDEPHHKTPFTVSLEVPRGDLAVSSMPEKMRQDAGAWTQYFFETSPPLPTYLLAWAVGALEVRSLEPDPGRHPKLRLVTTVGRSGRGELALAEARAHLSFLESYFESPYPYPKLDILAVPEFGALAMENVGLVTFREEALLVTEDSPVFARKMMSSVMAHELSHMWFGNLVTLSWWDELWLNEAFATWMSNKAMEAVRPEFRAREGFLGWLGGAMWEDTLPTARAIRQPVKTQTDSFRAFSGITYAKGAAVLDMTEEWIGDDAFQKGVIRYLDHHAFGTATSEDLFAALGSTGQPVRKMMSSFTGQSGVPLLRVSVECQDSSVSLKVEQEPFFSLGSDHRHLEGRQWLVPLCVALGTPDGRLEECHLLSEGVRTFPSKSAHCPSWVHPNVDLNGYYHSALDVSELEKLVRVPPSTQSPREQLGVLRSMNVGAEGGWLEVGTFLRLGEVMLEGSDRTQAVWDELLGALHHIDSHLLEPAERPQFMAYVERLVGAPLTRLGFEGSATDSFEAKGLRGSLFSAAARLARNKKAIEWSLEVARAFVKNPESVSREVAGRALPIAARENDRELFEGFLALSRSSQVAEDRVLVLGSLGQTTQPELVQLLLDKILKKEISPADARHVLGGLVWESSTRTVVYPWLLDHFEALAGMFDPFTLREFVSGASERCGLEDREAIEKALRVRLEKLEGMDEVLAESRESARRCAAYKAHHGASLSRFLGARPPPSGH